MSKDEGNRLTKETPHSEINAFLEMLGREKVEGYDLKHLRSAPEELKIIARIMRVAGIHNKVFLQTINSALKNEGMDFEFVELAIKENKWKVDEYYSVHGQGDAWTYLMRYTVIKKTGGKNFKLNISTPNRSKKSWVFKYVDIEIIINRRKGKKIKADEDDLLHLLVNPIDFCLKKNIST